FLLQEKNFEIGRSRISNPEIPKFKIGLVTTTVADSTVQFEISGFRDLNFRFVHFQNSPPLSTPPQQFGKRPAPSLSEAATNGSAWHNPCRFYRLRLREFHSRASAIRFVVQKIRDHAHRHV